MVRLLSRLEINDDKWDACVLNSPCFRHYALSYFLDATSSKWQAIVSEDYQWVWPLPIKKNLVSKVYQPLLAQQLGPFGHGFDGSDFDNCMNLIQNKFWGYNIKFNEFVEPNWLKNPVEHINVELAIDESYEVIETRFNRNARSNLKKADVTGVEISREDNAVNRIITMFKQGRGKEIEILNSSFYENVESIYNSFAERNEAEVWVARINGEIVAGIMLLKTNKRLLNFFTGSKVESRKTGAMHLLVSTIIRRYCDGGYVLDFEGSNNENLAYFYKSFGGVEKVYLQSHQKWNLPIKT